MVSKSYEEESRQFWIAHKSPGADNEPTIAFENARYEGCFLGIDGNWLSYKKSKAVVKAWTLKACDEKSSGKNKKMKNKGKTDEENEGKK